MITLISLNILQSPAGVALRCQYLIIPWPHSHGHGHFPCCHFCSALALGGRCFSTRLSAPPSTSTCVDQSRLLPSAPGCSCPLNDDATTACDAMEVWAWGRLQVALENWCKSIHDMWLLSMVKTKGLPISKGTFVVVPESEPCSFELSLPSIKRILLLPENKLMVAR